MIHRIALPTPFRIGRVNTYLIEDDPLTLVDAGPKSEISLAELEKVMGEIGYRVDDLERIVLTHQHLDHMGMANLLAQRSGAEVCSLDTLAPWLADYVANMEADDEYSTAVMARHGIAREQRAGLRAVSSTFHSWAEAVTVTTPLAPGSELAFANRTWRVDHRPGHSPSDTVFHDESSGELIAGDHLLKSISSNPLITRPLEGGEPEDRPKTLIMYQESLRATRAMEVSRAFGGHGEEIDDHRTLIDQRMASQNRRGEKIHGLLAERPHTAPELARALWGGDIAMTQAYLTLSEVLGHTDVLIAAGRVREDVDGDGVVRFSAV
jgi:glyoxylase-like metal-dependent hydrolase (beta-lactamase superfamily II)